MSVASSRASEISVSFNGKETSLEEALDETCRMIQNYLNGLQSALRRLACLEDQEIGEDLFKAAVELEDETVDLVIALTDAAEELCPIAAQVRGDCPKNLKEWHKTHKAEVRARRIKEKEEAKEKEKSAQAK